MQGLSQQINVLPPATIAKLRSTQLLTSLPQIVSELVQNSLDAGALSITLGIDCEEWSCWVMDDGNGITKEGLLTIGRSSDQGRYGAANHLLFDACVYATSWARNIQGV